jgi:hypothetical protein
MPRPARDPPDLYQKGNPVDDKSVTPDPWAAIANELERIAADAKKLIGHTPPGLVAFDIQPQADVQHPPVPSQRAETIQAVDDVANAFLGKDAETRKMGDTSFHHTISGRRGRISVSIYQAIADPEIEDPQEELKRLRARVAELEAGHLPALVSDETIEQAARMEGQTWNEREGRWVDNDDSQASR